MYQPQLFVNNYIGRDTRLAAAILFYYGQICHQQSRRSEAIEAWKSAASIAPESHAGQAAAKLIKTI